MEEIIVIILVVSAVILVTWKVLSTMRNNHKSNSPCANCPSAGSCGMKYGEDDCQQDTKQEDKNKSISQKE